MAIRAHERIAKTLSTAVLTAAGGGPVALPLPERGLVELTRQLQDEAVAVLLTHVSAGLATRRDALLAVHRWFERRQARYRRLGW